MGIILRSQAELEKIHRAGLIVWDVLTALRDMIRPGMTTMDLERFAERRTAEHSARPAFKGYRGYPCVLCTSINQEVIYGIQAATRELREVDIICVAVRVGCEDA